jgi:hypothetical protein
MAVLVGCHARASGFSFNLNTHFLWNIVSSYKFYNRIANLQISFFQNSSNLIQLEDIHFGAQETPDEKVAIRRHSTNGLEDKRQA